MNSGHKYSVFTAAMRGVIVGSCVGLLVLSVSPTTASAAAAPPARSTLQAQVNALVAAGAPGAVVGVRDERGSWKGAAGKGDVATGARPNPGRTFRIGSVTKTFTATMVLQLVAEKRIDLDAPIDKYLPGLLPYKETITVRQLLGHRSGLVEYGDVVWPDPKTVADRRNRNYTPTELVQIATKEKLRFKPGSDFFYSNTDYIVLGLLIEKVTHHSVDTELKRRILRRAGLKDTSLAGSSPNLKHPAMRGYEALDAPDGPLTDLTAYNMSVSWTTGAIVSTTSDVNRFYKLLVTGALIPKALLNDMKQGSPAFPGFTYGLGLAGGELCGQKIWGHVGGVPGYETYSFTNDNGKRQITVAVNRSLTLKPEVNDAMNATLATEFCGATPGS